MFVSFIFVFWYCNQFPILLFLYFSFLIGHFLLTLQNSNNKSFHSSHDNFSLSKYLSNDFLTYIFSDNILYKLLFILFILFFWVCNQIPILLFLYFSMLVGHFLLILQNSNNKSFHLSHDNFSLSLFSKYSSNDFLTYIFSDNILYKSLFILFIFVFWVCKPNSYIIIFILFFLNRTFFINITKFK